MSLIYRSTNMPDPRYQMLTANVRQWGLELGFQQIAVTDTDLGDHEPRLLAWLRAGYHGEMAYMSRHGSRRSRPAELIPGTIRIISARMDYLPEEDPEECLRKTGNAYISRYALGRDYHKVLRKRLAGLQSRMLDWLYREGMGQFHGRVFTDSAPVLEKAVAEKAGLGWIGKNTLLLNRHAGSWFFLGEIYTNVPLVPDDQVASNHCGSCTACIDICPTRAIVAPYQLDARRCISYLTIEHRGAIPVEFRRAIGNRVFGCDDCQIVCPWNRYASMTREGDFKPRHGLDSAQLMDLFAWSEEDFLKKTEGSPLRRTGYHGWLRNLAVALGNAPADPRVINALRSRLVDAPEMVAEHIRWAIDEQEKRIPLAAVQKSQRGKPDKLVRR